MTDADIVREQLHHLGPERGATGEAALDALVAERDEALRLQSKIQDIAIERKARAETAEAEVARLREAMRNSYPTEWAYEQACAALEKHKARAEAAEAEVARLNHENAALEIEGRTLREALAPFAGIVFADNAVAEEWILAARAALAEGETP